MGNPSLFFLFTVCHYSLLNLTTPFTHVTLGTVMLSKPVGAKWIKFNVDQYGYYRVNYELALWDDLISVLHQNPEVSSIITTTIYFSHYHS